MTRLICILSLIVPAILWTGCASRTSLNSQQKLFLLETSSNPQRHSAPVDGILKIRHCRAAVPFDSRYFLYRTEVGRYQQDYYKLFLTPPNEQINERLRVWLEQSGLFRGVLPSSSSARPNYVLEPYLSALYCDFSDPQPKTTLKLHVVLLKINKDKQAGEIVMEKSYENVKPLLNNTSQEVIKNYNLGFETIFTQLQSDLVSFLR